MEILLPIVHRFVAGTTAEDAIEKAKHIKKHKVHAILDHLGEDVKTKEDIDNTVREYLRLMNEIKFAGLNSHISIKLSSLGLHTNHRYCFKTVDILAKEAKYRHLFIWIDMEGSKDTTLVLDLYSHLLDRHTNVGLCIQAYLRRSESDLRNLLGRIVHTAQIRLVKGAYKEDSTVAFATKEEVNENYKKIMRILFERGKRFHIATHDEKMIDEAKKLALEYKRSPHEYAFALLMGVKDSVKIGLAKQGYSVYEYIPYGKQWFPYFSRRIRERKENLFFALRAIFSR